MARRPIGKIKITTKTTVRRKVSLRQEYHSEFEINPQPVSLPVSTVPSTTSLENSVKKLESAIKKLSRPTKLPAGVYSPQVETLYDEINKRSKPEEAEEKAMYDVFISHASEDKKDFVQPLVEALQNAGIRVWYDTLEL